MRLDSYWAYCLAILSLTLSVTFTAADEELYRELANEPEQASCITCEAQYNLLDPEQWLDPTSEHKYSVRERGFGYGTDDPVHHEDESGFGEFYFKNGMLFTRGSVEHTPSHPAEPKVPRHKWDVPLGTRIDTSWIKVDDDWETKRHPFESRPRGGATHFMVITKSHHVRYSYLFPSVAPEDSLAVVWTPEFIQFQTQNAAVGSIFPCQNWEVDVSVYLEADGVTFHSSCGSSSKISWEDAGLTVPANTEWSIYLGAHCDGANCQDEAGWCGFSCFSIHVDDFGYKNGIFSGNEHTDFLPSIAKVSTHTEGKCLYGLPSQPMFLGPGNAHYRHACQAPTCANTPISNSPWITLDFGRYSYVDFVVIKNSYDMGLLTDYDLLIGNSPDWEYNAACPDFEGTELKPGVRMTFACGGFGRYLTLVRKDRCSGINVCELLPYGEASETCGVPPPKGYNAAKLSCKFTFTEVSQSYEESAAYWPVPVAYKSTGTVYFRGFVFFSGPVDRITEADLVVESGHVLKVVPSIGGCSAEIYGYMYPPPCKHEYTQIPKYLCIQTRGNVRERFIGGREFPVGEPYCVAIPEYEKLACQKACLTAVSNVHMSSNGPVTTQGSVSVMAQFSFHAYVTKDWFDVYGPYGTVIESLAQTDVLDTYLIQIGLHFPKGKVKVCFNQQYLNDLRIAPVSCLTIFKKNYTDFVGPVTGHDMSLHALEATYPQSPKVVEHFNAFLPNHAIVTKVGDEQDDPEYNAHFKDTYQTTEDLLAHERHVQKHGKKTSILDILSQGFHSIVSPYSSPKAAIDERLEHYHDYHRKDIKAGASKTSYGMDVDPQAWTKLQGSAIEDAFRSLITHKDPLENLPAVLKELGFVLSDYTVTGMILGYDGLLTCLEQAKTEDGAGINGMALVLCPVLPEFLRPTLIKFFLKEKYPVVEPWKVLGAVMPNKESAETILDDPACQKLIKKLFNYCSNFVGNGTVDYVGCLRPAGFVFDDGALVKVTPGWVDILLCLKSAAHFSYDDQVHFNVRKLAQCEIQLVPVSLAAGLDYQAYFDIVDIARLLFPRTVHGGLDSVPADDPVLVHVLKSLAYALCEQRYGQSTDFSCLEEHGITIDDNVVHVPPVYETLILGLLNAAVELEGDHGSHFYLRVQRLLSFPHNRQQLKGLQPHVLVALSYAYSYLGTRYHDYAVKRIWAVLGEYQRNLYLSKQHHYGQRHLLDTPPESVKGKPYGLLQATYPFVHDLLPLHEVVHDMLALVDCSYDLKREKDLKVEDLVRTRDAAMLKQCGIVLGEHGSPQYCISGWNYLYPDLLSAKIDEVKPQNDASGRRLLQQADDSTPLDSGALCASGALLFCNGQQSNTVRSTTLAPGLGVETPEIDTVQEITDPGTAALLQSITSGIEECGALNCEGVPLCLEAAGVEFADDNCQTVVGATQDFYDFIDCADKSQVAGSGTQFNTDDMLTCFEGKSELSEAAGGWLRTALAKDYRAPVEDEEEYLDLPEVVEPGVALRMWPMVQCIQRCNLGKSCMSLYYLTLLFDDHPELQGMELDLMSFSCSPLTYSVMLNELRKYHDVISEPDAAASRRLLQSGSLYDYDRLKTCHESLEMTNGDVLRCGVKSLTHIYRGSDISLSKLPLIACIACSLTRTVGDTQANGAPNPLSFINLGDVATQSDVQNSTNTVVSVIALPDADPPLMDGDLDGYYDEHAPPSKIEVARFFLDNVNMFYGHVERHPDIEANPQQYNDLFHKVVPFTVSFHKRLLGGDDNHGNVEASILGALVENMRPLEYLKDYEKNYAVFLGSVLGSVYGPCVYGGKCFPDMQFASKKYLPVLEVLNGNAHPELSPELFSALEGMLDYVDLSVEDMLSFLGLDFSNVGEDAASGLHVLFPVIEKLVGAGGEGGISSGAFGALQQFVSH